MNGDAFLKKKSNFGLYLLPGVIGPWRYWPIKEMQIQTMPSGGRSLKSFYEASIAVEMSINSIISIMMQQRVSIKTADS